MINFQVILVLCIVLYIIISLYLELLHPVVTFLIAVVALLAFDIIEPREAIEGFGNEQVAVIILLLIIGNIFRKTSVLSTVFNFFFKSKNTSGRAFIFKLATFSSISSAFINNTPIVAMLIPYVYNWCKEHKISPSKFLIPLSYATILGGCATLIGTSTNLVVNGLAIDYGLPSLNIFDFTVVGSIICIIGIIYLTYFSDKLLPAKEDLMDKFLSSTRKFFLETHVNPDSSLIGKNINNAGLRNLKGLFLIGMMKHNKVISPVSPDEIMGSGDVLFFQGEPDAIADLTKPSLGLSLPKECNIPLQEKNDVVEIVVSHNSRLIGRSVRDTDFRGRYDGGILAIHRNGEKLLGQIGKLSLKAGDVLLVLAGKDFFKRMADSPAFYLISKTKEIHNVNYLKEIVLLGGLLVSILLSVLGWAPLFISLSALLLVLVMLKLVSGIEIRNGIDYQMLLIIVFGLALGKGMINSGAAQLIADNLLGLFIPWGAVGMLAGIFVITNLLSSFMTTKASVAIILPIVVSLLNTEWAHQLSLNYKPFVIMVALGGAANFITPIGYQTNLMVYGPGGYSFKDYFKIGLPLTIIYLILSVLILGLTYNLI